MLQLSTQRQPMDRWTHAYGSLRLDFGTWLGFLPSRSELGDEWKMNWDESLRSLMEDYGRDEENRPSSGPTILNPAEAILPLAEDSTSSQQPFSGPPTSNANDNSGAVKLWKALRKTLKKLFNTSTHPEILKGETSSLNTILQQLIETTEQAR